MNVYVLTVHDISESPDETRPGDLVINEIISELEGPPRVFIHLGRAKLIGEGIIDKLINANFDEFPDLKPGPWETINGTWFINQSETVRVVINEVPLEEGTE